MLGLVVFATVLLPGSSLADDPDGWKASQFVPGTHSSCCVDSDSIQAEQDYRNGKTFTHFFYPYTDDKGSLQVGDSGWMEVPKSTIILDGKPNPTGRPMVWFYPQATAEAVRIRCFKPGNDG